MITSLVIPGEAEVYMITTNDGEGIMVSVNDWGLVLRPQGGLLTKSVKLTDGNTIFEVWREKQIPLPIPEGPLDCDDCGNQCPECQ